MAKFVVDGIGDVCLSFQAIARIPDSTKSEMLNAGANVIVVAQQAAAPHKDGTLAGSIQKQKPMLNYEGGYIEIVPMGIHHKNKSGRSRYRNRGTRGGGSTRNAEVAFIHEFGAPGRNIPGRQWMLKTNDAHADKAVDAELSIYDQWLAKSGL